MHGNACTNLGIVYWNGYGAEKNIDTADMYFWQACDLYHDGDGCDNRAYMYSKGLNGPVDEKSAKKYKRAAEKYGSVNILMGLFKKQTTHKKIKRALL